MLHTTRAMALTLTMVGLSLPAKATPLPTDLRDLNKTFNDLVIDETAQDEMKLTLEFVSIDLEPWEANGAILARESQRFAEAGPTVTSFDFEALGVATNDKLQRIFKALYGRISLPFFCMTYRTVVDHTNQGLWDRDFIDSQCRKDTAALLRPLVAAEHNLFSLYVQGEYYGDDDQFALYIRSNMDKSEYLRIQFDILHEI